MIQTSQNRKGEIFLVTQRDSEQPWIQWMTETSQDRSVIAKLGVLILCAMCTYTCTDHLTMFSVVKYCAPLALRIDLLNKR